MRAPACVVTAAGWRVPRPGRAAVVLVWMIRRLAAELAGWRAADLGAADRAVPLGGRIRRT